MLTFPRPRELNPSFLQALHQHRTESPRRSTACAFPRFRMLATPEHSLMLDRDMHPQPHLRMPAGGTEAWLSTTVLARLCKTEGSYRFHPECVPPRVQKETAHTSLPLQYFLTLHWMLVRRRE